MPSASSPSLNESQLEYKRLIDAKLVAMQQATKAYRHVRDNCPHDVINHHGSAKCVICEQFFGHWCPSSPDSACHYHTDEHNKVPLINRTYGKPPKGHNAAHETYDACIFCGHPEERK